MDKKTAVVMLLGLVMCASMVSAYNFPGMDNLSDFIDDIVDILPKIIPLIIVGVIILVVKNFGKMMGGLLNWVGLK